MDAEDRQDGPGTHSDLISAARGAVSAQLWAEAVSLYQQVGNDDLLGGKTWTAGLWRWNAWVRRPKRYRF